MGMAERDFQSIVIHLAQRNGFLVAHFRAARVTRRDKHGNKYDKYETPVAADGKGFPDLVMVKQGRMIVAELKSDKGVLSKDQKKWVKAMHSAGVEAYVWRPKDWSVVQKILSRENHVDKPKDY